MILKYQKTFLSGIPESNYLNGIIYYKILAEVIIVIEY